LKGKNEYELDVFRLGSNSPLGFKVSSTNAGQVQTGDDRPKLSPDGQWLAYGMSGRLWLAAVDGSQPPIQITKFSKGEVDLLLGGWSPNGQSLLFHQGLPKAEDAKPMPPGISEGFYQLSLKDKRVTYVPELKGFDVWDSDSLHIFYVNNRDKKYELVRASTSGGPEAVLQETDDGYGFGQITRCGSDLAYLLKARIERSKPNGSGLVHITPQGGIADFQLPFCSPDALSVMYQHNVKSAPNGDMTVEVSMGGSVKALHQCKGGCSKTAWESATSILVLDAGTVHRVSLAGVKETVATGVVDLVLPED